MADEPLRHDSDHPISGRLSMTRPHHRAHALAVAETRQQNSLLFWRLSGLAIAAACAWYMLPSLQLI